MADFIEHSDPTLRLGSEPPEVHDLELKKAILQAHDYACALCSKWRKIRAKAEECLLMWPIIDPRLPKGAAQLEWIHATGIAPNFKVASTANHLPLCWTHVEALTTGEVVLCPSLDDLRYMIQYEEADWERRIAESTPTEQCLRRTPSLKELTGYIDCMWIGRSKNETGHLPNAITPSTYPGTDVTELESFPQQVVYLREVRGCTGRCPQVFLPKPESEIDVFRHGLLLNPPENGPPAFTLNPFACLTYALGVFNGTYLPPDIFYVSYTRKGDITAPVLVPSAIPAYESCLLDLRDLYSRTCEDLRLERERRAISKVAASEEAVHSD
ncbi:hypothetical protein FKP32DRAFT_1754682 [Trametes sanguinea]|nr:hypothetical protein FKP32DRAFT_1754682 [Trametes sanguinea]